MFRLFLAGLDAAVASVLVIPVFLMLNRLSFHSFKKTFFYTVLAVYLAGVYLVAGLPNVAYIRFEPNINPVPFVDLFSDLSAAVLNVLLFIPLGFLSAVLWKPLRIGRRNLMLGFGVSLAVELFQMFTFRATDVNDLITNTLGTMTGWWMAAAVLKYFPGIRCNGSKKEFVIVFGTVLCIMFFIHPFIAPMIWNLFC